MEKEFKRVNTTYATGMDYLKRTIETYKALKEAGTAMRPKELAAYMNRPLLWDGTTHDYCTLVHPLHWLYEMGMVGRIECEEVIEINFDFPHYEYKSIVVDGIEYTAKVKVDAGPMKKTVKYYKWHVI